VLGRGFALQPSVLLRQVQHSHFSNEKAAPEERLRFLQD
jgi:hypothetical protein